MGDTPGGQFEIPRAIIRAVANHYVEMAPGTTREQTFCCGGGGGLLTDELLDLRVKGALPRMEALQQVVDDHGVNFMATICAICKAQFTKVLPYYGFKMGMVGGVHQLVSTAIRLGAQALNATDDHYSETRRCRPTTEHRPRKADLPPLQGRRQQVEALARADLPGELHAQVPDLHPVDAALPGQLPVGRGHPRLPEHRARHREAAGAGMPWQEYAWRRLTEANPFPSVMGRVCPAPCETGCNRNEVEDHVGINSVEHFLGEYAIAQQADVRQARADDRQEGRRHRRRPGRPVRAPTSWRARATTSRSSTSTSTSAA